MSLPGTAGSATRAGAVVVIVGSPWTASDRRLVAWLVTYFVRRDLHVGQPQVDGHLDVDLCALGRRLVERDDHDEPVLDEPEDVPLVGELVDAEAPLPQLDPQVVLRDLAALDGDGDVG